MNASAMAADAANFVFVIRIRYQNMMEATSVEVCGRLPRCEPVEIWTVASNWVVG